MEPDIVIQPGVWTTYHAASDLVQGFARDVFISDSALLRRQPLPASARAISYRRSIFAVLARFGSIPDWMVLWTTSDDGRPDVIYLGPAPQG